MNNILKTLKTPLSFHWSLVFLLILFLIQLGAIGFVLFAILMFSLLVHEYGHIFISLKNNIKVERISIFALGAVAFIDPKEMIFNKNNSLKISIAGPLSSLGLALVASVLSLFIKGNYIINYFFVINIMLFLFNLLPLFPLDGGRILYSLLSFIMPEPKAMKVSVYSSCFISIIGIIFCIFYSRWLLLSTFLFILYLSIMQYIFFKKFLLNILKDSNTLLRSSNNNI